MNRIEVAWEIPRRFRRWAGRLSQQTKPPLMRLIVPALLIGSQATNASAASDPVALSLILNGRATGLVGEFLSCDDEPCATAAQLTELGFLIPPNLAAGSAPIRLSAFPNVHARIDESTQVIYVEAADSALRPSEITGQSLPPLAPLSPSGYGAVLNYDILGSFSKAQSNVGALISVRAFSPYGLLETAAVVTVSASSGPNSLTRLNTTYSYSDPERLRRWRIGDVVTGALAWNRAVRLGGIQVSSDFNLRPDLVTYPLPAINSSTAVPATVSVIANGALQSREAIRPGPFAAHVMPVISGAGEVSVAVQDELGRQTVITSPFYASSELLKPGLASYSLEVGMIRENYGSLGDHYAGWAASGSLRRGITDWLTLEAHGETTRSLGLLGIGATARIGSLGVVNVALSGSGQPGINGQFGKMLSLGVKRTARRFSFSASGALYTIGYRDIATIRGFTLPKSTLNASVAYSTDRWGAVGISYIARSSYLALNGGLGDQSPRDARDARFRIVNASYSARATRFGTFYVNGYYDLLNHKSYGISAGFSFFFGGHTSATLGSSFNGGRATQSVGVARSALEPNDFGYRLQAYQGGAARRSAEVEYLSQSGRLSGGVEQYQNEVIGRLGARGALAFAAGKVFSSGAIDDSFAVVSTGGVGNVPVRHENRLIGITNSAGLLLVPSLLSYQNNRLSFDSSGLPPDVIVGQTFVAVRPRGGSVATVDFQIGKLHAALVRLRDRDDKPIPMGSIVQVPGQAAQPVGYDGEAYVNGLSAQNMLKVTLPNGTSCTAHLEYQAVAGDIPTIGPVRCQ